MSILFKINQNIAYIQFNRPKAFNSFNRQQALDLLQKLQHCSENETIRTVVITGSGRAFCAGQDLVELTDDNGIGFEILLKEHYNPIVRAIRSLEKPVIAAVNGVAAGAGANIAFCCDFTIASESAVFTQAFSKIGLVPDSGGTLILPRLVGLQRATAMMMLSNKITAKEAVDMGLIYQAVADEDLEQVVQDLATKLSKMPTKALGMTKKLINAGLYNTLDEQLEMEGDFQVAASATEDYKEGVAAFLEKRRPVFKGK
jgi:2-(1,2-epoxy-1,2-dihydrophenyl)acetyl-CoA isomerase